MTKAKNTDNEGRQAYIVRENESIHVATESKASDGKITMNDRKYTQGEIVYLSEDQYSGLKLRGRNALREATPSELKKMDEQISTENQQAANAELEAVNAELRMFEARKRDALQRLTVEEENLKHRQERAQARSDEFGDSSASNASKKPLKGPEPDAPSRPSSPAGIAAKTESKK